MIVTIDGPAGSGKSTAARGLAQRLGFDYIDTGAMYRAVAHSCLASDIDTTDRASVTERAAELRIGFDGQDVLLDGVNISTALRSPSISEAASRVAQHPGVRAEMVRQQQAMVRERDLVPEVGTRGPRSFPTRSASSSWRPVPRSGRYGGRKNCSLGALKCRSKRPWSRFDSATTATGHERSAPSARPTTRSSSTPQN